MIYVYMLLLYYRLGKKAAHIDQSKKHADISTTSTSTNSPTPSSHEPAHTESECTTIPVENETVDAEDRPEAAQLVEGPTASADTSILPSEIAGHK